MTFAVADPGLAFVWAEDDGGRELYRSVDSGASWTALSPALPCLSSLATDVAVADHVQVSTDTGTTWSPFDSTGFPGDVGHASALVMAPSSPPVLHAGTGAGVFSYFAANEADLSVSKDNQLTELSPGDPLTYEIEVDNLGPGAVVGATVTDLLPSALDCSWTCSASGGSCTAGPVSGNVQDAVDIEAGGSVAFSLSCTLAGSASGLLVNTATVAVPASQTDPVATNDSATDQDVILELGGCGVYQDRALSGVSVTGIETFEACATLSTGPQFSVSAAGNATLRAGSAVTLRDGTSVAVGGILTVELAVPAP